MVDTAAIRCNRTADCQRNDIVEISTALQNWRRETIVMPPGGDMQHYYYYNLYCCHNSFVYQVSSTVHTAKLNVSDVNCCEFTLKLLMTVTRVFQWRRCRLQEDQSATGNDDKRASSVGSAQVWHRGNSFTGYCLLVVLLPAVLKTSSNQLPSSFRQPHPVHCPPGSPHLAHITSSQSPPSLSSPITASTFHSRLKTHLFHKSFPP